jgi:Tfp pilus assembly protein PilX
VSCIRKRLLHAQEGFALLIALACLLVLSTATTSVIVYSTSNETSAVHSSDTQLALSVAEAGLNMALARLEVASDPSMANAVPAAPVAEVAVEKGFASYDGSLDATAKVWTLTGIGRVPNPSNQTNTIRTVHMQVKLGSATKGSANNAIWNYVYADAPTGCTSIGNSVNMNVPFYIRGNLCMSNSAQVTSYALQVGGSLTMSNQSGVGSASAPIHEVHVAGGCSRDGVHYDTVCTSADGVYGSIVDNKPTTFTKPPVDMAGTYQTAMPGPKHPCTTGSVPWGGFDNDSTPLNVSLGTISLVPKNQPYDCKVYDASNQLVGELGWDGNGTLTVLGTIFLDANIQFSQLNTIVYKGKATIYAAGTITVQNHTSICGAADCGSDWDVSKNLLAWVSGAPCPANGSQLNGFYIDNFSTMQGAVYTVCDYAEGNNTTFWGPVISRQVYIQNSTTNFYVPIGTPLPGMPATYDVGTTLTPLGGSWSG